MAFTTTASGLQYEDTVVGNGAEATRGAQVRVHYTGWLYNDGQQGAKFDSSRDRNDPFVFPLGAGMVIKGWDEGIALMKEMYIPHGKITVIFTVQEEIGLFGSKYIEEKYIQGIDFGYVLDADGPAGSLYNAGPSQDQ